MFRSHVTGGFGSAKHVAVIAALLIAASLAYVRYAVLAMDSAVLKVELIPAAVWLFCSVLGVLRLIRRQSAFG